MILLFRLIELRVKKEQIEAGLTQDISEAEKIRDQSYRILEKLMVCILLFLPSIGQEDSQKD